MTTSKQARNSRFQRGSGTYVCQSCGHQTRDTGLTFNARNAGPENRA